MKNVFLFCAIVFCTYSYAFQTVLTSSIYASDEVDPIFTSTNTEIPTTHRRVRLINRLNSNPEIAIALTASELIFSAAMSAERIDLVPIVAEVINGNASEFDIDEVCKVSVLYTDMIVRNYYYNNINDYKYNYLPTLIPKTMYNQCEGTSSNPTIQIKLNPTISYHYDTSPVPNDKCDAITIFLRALAIGCGIHSTLDPDSLKFGIINDGVTYINAFDSKIFNDLGDTYSDVADGYITATYFLENRKIYAKGFSSPGTPMDVQLFNDWENGIAQGGPLTYKTLNTVSVWNYTDEEVENDFYDLLDTDLGYGIEQRTVSNYTMALLRGLGWEKTIPVGFDDEYHIDDATLCCSSTTLLPNQTYSVWLSENVDLNNLMCRIESVDSSYVIGSCTSNSFSYSTIPNNIQWKRNPITKNIVGQLECKAGLRMDIEYVEKDKTCAIEIPYRPNRPLVQQSESTTNGVIALDLKAFANGSDVYTITYTGVTYDDIHTFTVEANALDTILNNIPANQLYDLSIYGTNSEGNSDTYNFTFGYSSRPALNMTVAVTRTTLIYDLSSNGTIDISNVVINSVKITDTQGGIVMSPQAMSGESIDISGLARGTYVLTVIADGTSYSRTFIKR